MSGLTADQVTNAGALPPIPLPLQSTDIIVLYRAGLPDPIYQGPLSALIALAATEGLAVQVIASENVAKGAALNIWNNGGQPNARNANGAAHGKPCHAFAVAATLAGQPVTAAFLGVVAGVAGLTPGPVYLGATPGNVSSAPLTTIGQTAQIVGVCVDATGQSFVFQPQGAVNL